MTTLTGFETIRQVGRMLRRHDVSALEAARSSLERLRTLGPRLNALAELMPEVAERDARRADRRLSRGDSGKLVGIPYGAKDIIATAGTPTRWGAPPFRHQVFDFDASLVRRLRDAGAVLAAKLSTVELAGAGLYGTPNASIDGPGRNPWDLGHWSGGSSSGPGAAVASGLVPFALGSETRGSIMIPAAFCGVTAIRPSYGTVTQHGVFPVSWSFDKIGPFARSAADCAIVLQAIAGYDESDPRTIDWELHLPRRRRLRLGLLPIDFDGEPEIQRAFEEALRTLRRLGHRPKQVRLPDRDYLALSQRIGQGETVGHHEDFIRSARLEELVDTAQKERLRSYLAQPVSSYPRAAEERLAAIREIRRLFREVDVLVAPTWVMEAPAIDADLRSLRRLYGGPAVLGALAGLPAVSVPMGFGRTGMPLGLCITADALADGLALRLAMDFQSATDWHERRPPLDRIIA